MSETSRWFVSEEFLGSGIWLVHQHGGNRPYKIARCPTRDAAEMIAAALNAQEAPHA